MRKIRFATRPNMSAYECSEPGDNSGYYYQSTDVDELMQKVRDVLEETKRAIESSYDNDRRRLGLVVPERPVPNEGYLGWAYHKIDTLLAKLTPKE